MGWPRYEQAGYLIRANMRAEKETVRTSADTQLVRSIALQAEQVFAQLHSLAFS